MSARPNFVVLLYPGPTPFARGATPKIPRNVPPTFIASPGSGDRVHAVWADEYFAAWLQRFPISATFSGVPEAPNDRLDDNALPAIRAWERREDRWLSALRELDAGGLRGRPEEVVYGILRETLEASRQNGSVTPSCGRSARPWRGG